MADTNLFDFLKKVAHVQNEFIELVNRLVADGYVADIGPVGEVELRALDPAPSDEQVALYIALKPFLSNAYLKCKDVSANQVGSISNLL